jgi:antitoxin VapB
MALNIKSEEAHRLARELAELTGESMTVAVTAAVRERRDRVRSESEGGLSGRLLEIGRETAERLPASARDVDHGQLLYGDDGLPK